MDDKDFEATKEEIRRLVDKWRPLLCLDDYTVTLTYSRERCSEDPFRGAYTSTFWVYRDAEITFYVPQLKNSYKTLESLVLHELVHIVLAPISSNLEPGCEQQNEFVTENVTRLLLKMRGE